MTDRKTLLSDAKRVVVKVGTSNLTGADYRLDPKKVAALVADVMALKRSRGCEVILVSSGSIGAGLGKLGMDVRPQAIPLLQAAASIGQNILMSEYEKNFKREKQLVAQVLVTADDVADRKRYLNIRNTLNALLELNVIPVVNENDTVSVAEIKVGDNDTLSAMVAANLDADLLVMLTDIDGLCTFDPRRSKKSELISTVEKIDERIVRCAGGARKGVGGMATKITAARITTSSGIPLLIVNGNEKNVLQRAMAGEELGTFFLPTQKMARRDHWLLYTSRSRGTITVDAGAADVLKKRGSSLLPKGIASVAGSFGEGDVVAIADPDGRKFAKGISNYASDDVRKIQGRHSRDIESILGRADHKEVVYSGNLVVFDDDR